jgi:hypothetical protein
MVWYFISFEFNGIKKTQSIQGDRPEKEVDSLRYKLIIDSAIEYWLKANKVNGMLSTITDIKIRDSEGTIFLKQDDWSDLNSIH